MPDRKKAFRNFYPALAWAFLILVVSGIPGNYIPARLPLLDWMAPDKMIHLFLFAILAFLLLRGSARYFYQDFNFRKTLIFLSIGIIFGLVTEALQRFLFIGRSGNWLDFLADVAGCLLGWALFALLYKKVIRSEKNN